MAINATYNYNNYKMGGQKYNSANENGINMALVNKGRLYESFESSGKKYYGASYTPDMQAQGKIGIPDDNIPGKHKIVDVDSDEGKARLAQLETERSDALAELSKFNDFKHKPAESTSTASSTSSTNTSSALDEMKASAEEAKNLPPDEKSATVSDKYAHARYGNRKYDTASFDMDKIREIKADMKGNIGAYKKMVYSQSKTQAGYADSALGKMLKEVANTSQADAAKAISDDGEWGVKATANRILDFAKALSGGDPAKIKILRDAVNKGFAAASKTWGGALPGICHDTLAQVMNGFDEWEKTGTASYSQA